ncbi:hypothetical protein [Nostoc sp. PA-18-2419]|uniref:hypothetical protein n=1 Tax=Nostoc sp. PA-18-2419 TaxID=2575443 RepID=UPI00167220D5|nr:hypothetical protein [Nostoc sp. PA-18-2419]
MRKRLKILFVSERLFDNIAFHNIVIRSWEDKTGLKISAIAHKQAEANSLKKTG